jgi:hypothetical protein
MPSPEPQVVNEPQGEQTYDPGLPEQPDVVVPPLDLQLNGKVDPENPSHSARNLYNGVRKPAETRRNSDDFVIDNTNMSDQYVPPLSKASNRKPRACVCPEPGQEPEPAETEQRVEMLPAEDVIDLAPEEVGTVTEEHRDETIPEATGDEKKRSKHSHSPSKGMRSSRRHSRHSRRDQSSESDSSDESYSDESYDSDDRRRRSRLHPWQDRIYHIAIPLERDPLGYLRQEVSSLLLRVRGSDRIL